jgi:Methyltransferase domain
MMRKPQLLLYPDSVHANHIAGRDHWALGVDYPECRHARFGDPRVDTIADEFLAAMPPATQREPPAVPRVARRTTMILLPEACRLIELDTTIPRLTAVADVQFLCWLARRTDGNIVEIGCNKGLPTRDLAITNPDKIVYAVDYFAEGPGVNDWQQAELPAANDFCVYARDLDNVLVVYAESARLNYDALRDVRMIFIDGNHTFEAVRADTERARAYLERNGGGWLLWHDYYDSAPFWVGVKRYVDSLDLAIEHVAETWLAIAKISALCAK